jgi:hypothetical protein
MIRNTFINLNLTENHVYRLGNVLVEAIFRDVWTLMVVTESGYHVPREHGALVCYKLRADGLWDTVHDNKTRRLLGWESWSFTLGTPTTIDTDVLVTVAESRAALKVKYQEREIDHKFRVIMSAMEW